MKLQSIIFGDASIEISYYEEETRNETGMKITTAVMNPLTVREEAADLVDSAEQLVMAWVQVHRQHAIPVPPPR